jgi:hypothetical protein
MGWQGQIISANLAEQSHQCFAEVKDGIAVIEHLGGENEVRFFYVLHLPTGIGIGYLFCQTYEVRSIVDQIVGWQDWMSVRSGDDILPSTRDAMSDFRRRYVFYKELPPDLELVLVRSEDPAAPRRR